MGSRSRHLCHSKLLGGEIKGDGRLDLLMTYTFSPRHPPPLPSCLHLPPLCLGSTRGRTELHLPQNFEMKLAASDGGFTGSDMQEVAKSTKSGRLLEYSMAQ